MVVALSETESSSSSILLHHLVITWSERGEQRREDWTGQRDRNGSPWMCGAARMGGKIESQHLMKMLHHFTLRKSTAWHELSSTYCIALAFKLIDFVFYQHFVHNHSRDMNIWITVIQAASCIHAALNWRVYNITFGLTTLIECLWTIE